MNTDRIPILNVEALHSTDEAAVEQLASEFFRVYSTVGFGYIVNHAVPDELVRRVFAATREFHALPLELKLSVELSELHRGYIPINTSTDVNSTLAQVTHPNQSESFMVMREDPPEAPQVLAGDYLAGSNQWPDLVGFRADVMAYNDAMSALAHKLTQVILKSVAADDAALEAFTTPTTWLRLLYYPPFMTGNQSTGDLAEQGVYGSAPHTDFGCLTILAQDNVGGLQVQSLEGDWIDVPRVPGSFVVNVGDMLHRWSNGLLRATPHRVINASGRARYSCPFFYDPNVSTDISPFESCVSRSHPAKFDSINFGDFLRSELEAGYAHHKKNS